jgi:hypothetical protein
MGRMVSIKAAISLARKVNKTLEILFRLPETFLEALLFRSFMLSPRAKNGRPVHGNHQQESHAPATKVFIIKF